MKKKILVGGANHRLVLGLVFTLVLSITGFSSAWAGESYIITEVGGSTAPNNGRKLVRDSDGNLHCVYQRAHQIYHSKSTDGGINWTEEAITSGNYDQGDFSIAIDSNDHIHVIWEGKHSGSPGHSQIRYRKYDVNTKSWGDIENLTSGDYGQISPSIAIDSNDHIHIVWAGRHSGSPSYSQIRYKFLMRDFLRKYDMLKSN